MDAPLYPPAAAYHAPASVPFVFGIDTVTVQEAAATPALLTILTEEAPQMKLILKAPQALTHVSNWSIRSLGTLELVSAGALARIERRMLALPPAARPAL
jgi:hypothetical protein